MVDCFKQLNLVSLCIAVSHAGMVGITNRADPGGSLGLSEPPQRQRNFLEAILVGRGLNWVR